MASETPTTSETGVPTYLRREGSCWTWFFSSSKCSAALSFPVDITSLTWLTAPRLHFASGGRSAFSGSSRKNDVTRA